MRALVYLLIFFILVGFSNNPGFNWNERKERKMIKVSLPDIPTELDPTKLRTMNHFLLLQLFSQTLVRVDEAGDLVSYLAKRWEYNSNQKEYIFHLDEGAKFSDGSAVTSRDVVWSLSRHFWAQSSSVVANYLKVSFEHKKAIPVNHIHPAFKIVDKDTFTIHLKSFYGPLLHVLAMPGFSITKYKDGNFFAIGSGPLKIEKDENKNILSFKRNPFFKEPLDLNQVSIVKSPNIESTKKMFTDGVIDLALGVSRSDLDLKAISSLGVVITPTESLSVVHTYFNTRRIFKNEVYREIFSNLLSSAADDFAKNNLLFERLKTFFPIGIMPTSYYTKEISSKRSLFPKETVRIVLSENVFPLEFVEILKNKMRNSNISVQVILSHRPELMEALKNKDYDIIGTGYVGNFPDPDAFLELINSESPTHPGEFDSTQLFKSLDKARFNTDQEQRLSDYMKSFHEFEKNNYIVPLFRSKIPILHRKELSLPNTKFRYEGELWRIFWKN